MNKRSIWIIAAAALATAAALAGCGTTQYFANRELPPSGLLNRVMIAIQNQSAFSRGGLEIVDAYYDIRSGYTGTPASFSIAGYSGSEPITIQNMPEEQYGAVYGSGDGSLAQISYAGERSVGPISGLNPPLSSVFVTRNLNFAFAASQTSHVLTMVNLANGGSYPLSLPGVYRVSVNPGGSMAIAFVQNSNYAYYPQILTTNQSVSYSGGPSTWPKAAVDCEPQNLPTVCLFQAQSPDAIDSTGTYYGAPLQFDRPVKAVFSADGGTAYILSCGPECGGNSAAVSVLPVAPFIFLQGKSSGLMPCNPAPATCSPPPGSNAKPVPFTNIPVSGGASNALVDGSTMYVAGQQRMPDTFFGGYLTVLNLQTNSMAPGTASAPNPVSISDGIPGGPSRMVEGDDNTLWIAMTKCEQGERFNHNLPFGCITMYNTSTSKVVQLLPYQGDGTGLAAVTGLHKLYSAQGGQIYINSTVDGTAMDNQFVTVTGTAYDVAYIDATTDANNTVY